MTSQLEMQLGKNGLTQSFLEEIKKRFEKPELKNIKISVLKSARESRDDVKKYADELKNFLGNKFTYRIIGFSIFLKKWRKSRE
ncbi:YhbY family RNA-binding protein [Candidatus Pacearchaeota archaeon]|nr:YhbY family RNA-binding protein [Candidatus Pacearchaeota archaeon]